MLNKSILEVFGEKSQDGDKVKGLLLKSLMGNSYEEGGRVPKFKKGGGIFGFGKKELDNEALESLNAILSGGYEKELGKHEYPMGYTQRQDFSAEDGKNLFRIISKFNTPEGERYYPGEGTSRSHSLAQKKAMMDAASRAYHSPADSITTDQLAQLKKLGLFGE